uniref:Deoxynucleoside kinase domain-containing protein n=1 Tax=viral metagenome TaxID=1070528 RepID=A0A6C0JSU1_9ZZZZ
MENVEKLKDGFKIILSIDSVIGAGKTTLLNKYKKMYPQLTIIQEPVEKWVASGLLERFYEDPKRYVFQLQQFIMASFHDQLEEAFKKNAKYILMERGPLACFCVFSHIHYQNGMMTEEEYRKMEVDHYAYERALRERGYVLDHIYLATPLDVAMERLTARNRINEGSKVSREYQQQLLDRYQQLCLTSYTESQIDSLVAKVVEMLGIQSADNGNNNEPLYIADIGAVNPMRRSLTSFISG